MPTISTSRSDFEFSMEVKFQWFGPLLVPQRNKFVLITAARWFKCLELNRNLSAWSTDYRPFCTSCCRHKIKKYQSHLQFSGQCNKWKTLTTIILCIYYNYLLDTEIMVKKYFFISLLYHTNGIFQICSLKFSNSWRVLRNIQFNCFGRQEFIL
jgi:hypothetical protein